jgi:hypothetical protein
VRQGLLARERGRGSRAELALGAARVEALPGALGVGAELRCELRELLHREQRGVILRMTLDRQRPALDRVGEHHRRAIVLGGAVRLDQLAEVVAAEVAEAGTQVGVVELAY